MKNSPLESQNAWFHNYEVRSSDANYGSQIAVPMTGTDHIYFRNLSAGTWSGWRSIANSIDITNSLANYMPKSGGTFTGPITAPSDFRLQVSGNGDILFRNDPTAFYILITDTPGGNFNSARPLTISKTSGICAINGNAATATNVAWTGVTGRPTFSLSGTTLTITC